MAGKQKPEGQEPEEKGLVKAAKAIGKAAGKVAKLAEGAQKPPAAEKPVPVEKPHTPKTPRIPKLAAKNKSRLPRKLKKAQQKAAAARK